jgi:uncharacterized protein (TIGR00369 family)
VAEIVFAQAQQGLPGHVHGGASAAVLDEAMGSAVWRAGFKALAANLRVDYRRPLPIGQPVSVEARLVNREGQPIRAQGEIRLADGTVAVVARGIYIDAPHLIEKFKTLAQEGRDST